MTPRKTVKSRVSAGATAINPELRPEPRPSADLVALVRGIRDANRVSMGQAISLVESTRPDDRPEAVALLNECHGVPADSYRVAISGAPGVGKSTLIDAMGSLLIERGHRVAVLAIDPSSDRTGGSILGDKTRMPRLAASAEAFIRPSPTSGVLGGVGRNTRPAITICEAAGFDVVLVETVGVGQSEISVRGMVDFLLLLTLSGAGDELQGIKRGIVEVADLIAVTKADGANISAAERGAGQFRSALAHFPPDPSGWTPSVVVCSAQTGTGLEAIWEAITEQRVLTAGTGFRESRRRRQRVAWFHDEVRFRREERLSESAGRLRSDLIDRVSSGVLHPYAAAERFVSGDS